MELNFDTRLKMKNRICNIFRKSAYKTFMFIGLHQDGSITYQTQIARELKRSITTINYHITQFKGEGLIDQRLKLTELGYKTFKFLWDNEDKKVLRAHNIQIVFNVVKCPPNFPDCFSQVIYEPLQNKRYKGLKTKIDGFTIMFYSPKKIVCVLKDIFGDTDEEISGVLQLVIPELKKLLEYEFKGIRIENYKLARIQKMHIAVMDSFIAQTYLLKEFTEENKNFAIDKSHGIPEVELTNPSNALRDIMDLLNLDKIPQKSTLFGKKREECPKCDKM